MSRHTLSAAAGPSTGLAILAVLAALTPAAAPAADNAASLATATALYEVAPRERLWDGTVEAVNQATVSAQTSGRVAEVLFDVDDYVPGGAVIVRFTATEQQAALDAARAQLREAEARDAEAGKELGRVAGLFESDIASRADYDRALAARKAAAARLEAARSAVAAAREQFSYTEVRAPYAGIVSARHVEVGETVRPGQPLMSGLSLATLRVNVDVPQSVIGPIRAIGKAAVYVDGRRIEATGLTFFPYADPATNTFRVRVDLPEQAAELYPGMFVKVAFVIGESRRLLIPAVAVTRRSEVTAVYVVEDGRVSFRQIRAGRQFGDRIEVLAGLVTGEPVALDPVRAGMVLKEQDLSPHAG